MISLFLRTMTTTWLHGLGLHSCIKCCCATFVVSCDPQTSATYLKMCTRFLRYNLFYFPSLYTGMQCIRVTRSCLFTPTSIQMSNFTSICRHRPVSPTIPPPTIPPPRHQLLSNIIVTLTQRQLKFLDSDVLLAAFFVGDIRLFVNQPVSSIFNLTS